MTEGPVSIFLVHDTKCLLDGVNEGGRFAVKASVGKCPNYARSPEVHWVEVRGVWRSHIPGGRVKNFTDSKNVYLLYW